MDVFHYTNKGGWDAIRSQKVWPFRAFQPNHDERPYGAYFTDLPPTAENLRTLYQRLRVPNEKKDYVFWFSERHGLMQIRNGRGRDKHIFYSPSTYICCGREAAFRRRNSTMSLSSL